MGDARSLADRQPHAGAATVPWTWQRELRLEPHPTQRISPDCPIVVHYRRDRSVRSVLHSHTTPEIFYFHEGFGRYIVGNRIFTLVPGSLLLMNGLTLHCPRMSEGDRFVRSIVHFDPRALSETMDSLPGVDLMKPFNYLGNHYRRLNEADRREAERLLLELDEVSRAADTLGLARLRLRFLDFLAFVSHVVDDRVRVLSPVPSEKEVRVQAVIACIERRFAEDLSMADLEEYTGFDRYRIAHDFHEVTGSTVFTYLHERRVAEAKIRMLLSPQLAVTDISYAVGYKKPSHFSSRFKRHAGVSPSEFRRQLRRSETHGTL